LQHEIDKLVDRSVVPAGSKALKCDDVVIEVNECGRWQIVPQANAAGRQRSVQQWVVRTERYFRKLRNARNQRLTPDRATAQR
jgi:hypothetical protein